MKPYYILSGRVSPFLTLLLFYQISFGQSGHTVRGRVVAAVTETPLPGASIQLKGTSQGTTADALGGFTFTGTGSRVALRVSFIGYRPLDTLLQLPPARELVLHLTPDEALLDEVKVSTGYWESSKKLSTGNISKVTAETIGKQPVNNVLQALQGRMPGVYIQQQTGVPGGGFRIRIRGQNSLRNTSGDNGNEPLYVVDGVPYLSSPLHSGFTSAANIQGGNPLSVINPNDIERVEILKDADATAIFGSRGANGVVLITTRRAGEAVRPQVTVNASHGFGKVTRKLNLLNTEQYLQMRREAFANDGVIPTVTNAADLMRWDTTRYTDWQRELIGGIASFTTLATRLSAGSKTTRFQLGASYNREGTVFPGNFNNSKLAGTFTLSHRPEKGTFSLDLTMGYHRELGSLFNQDITTRAVSLPPNAPRLYNEAGNLNWEGSTWTNPLSILEQPYRSVNNTLISSAVVGLSPVNGLTLKLVSGYTASGLDEQLLSPIRSKDPATNPMGSAITARAQHTTWILEPQAQFEKQHAAGKLTILGGATLQETAREGESRLASGYTSDALLENSKAATSLFIYEANSTRYRYQSWFARVHYNYKDRYLLNLSGRRDGSTRFGRDRRFGNFGAIGAAWILTNEGFLKNRLSFLDFGKFRGSYGITGSDQITDYGYTETYAATSYPYNQNTGLIPQRLANREFGWEQNRKLELALELGFWQSRLELTGSWYRHRATDQLVGLPLPATTGFATVQHNLDAVVENTGWELTATTVNIRSKDLLWTTSLNLTIPRNRLVSYPGLASSPYANTYLVGHSLYIKRLYHYQGINPDTGNPMTEDVNGDGQYTIADRTSIRQVSQRRFGGLHTSVSYKRFELDMLWQFTKQTGYNYKTQFGAAGAQSNQPVFVMDRWRTPGDYANFQKFSRAYTAEYARFLQSDYTIGDASFIRLKNVSLSYTAPFQKVGVKHARIALLAQNLFTFTKYEGMDPENQSAQMLPPLTVVSLNLQLTF